MIIINLICIIVVSIFIRIIVRISIVWKLCVVTVSPYVPYDCLGESLQGGICPLCNISPHEGACFSMDEPFIYHPRFPLLPNLILEGFIYSHIHWLT